MRMMKKGIGLFLLLCLVFLVTCFVNDRIQLHREKDTLKPPGRLTEVNGHKLHVYTEGKGEETAVFMSGSGIQAPVWEFKGLYQKFLGSYRIAVVERAGYGYSESAHDTRDLDTVLEETRESLRQAGEAPPYILFPHSLSGLEAIYWAQKYPQEIKAIIGLDIGLPDEYAKHPLKKMDRWILKGESYLARLGVHRLFPDITYDPKVMESGFLTEEEEKAFKALSYKKALNGDMLNELKSIKANADQSLELPLPSKTPLLLFAANPSGKSETRKHTAEKIAHYEEFARQFEQAEVIPVEGKHSIYLYATERVAKETASFINHLDK